jgi:hypothetical protein
MTGRLIRLVVLTAVALGCATPAAAQTVRRPAGRTPPFRFVTITLGGHRTPARATTETTPTIYAEPARVRTSFQAPTGPAFDVGVGVRIRGRFGLGGQAGVTRATSNVTIDAEIPSPLGFNMHRPATKRARASRSTVDLDVDAWWMLRERGRWWLAAGGGLAVTRVSQDLDGDLRLTDAFPFDTVEIRNVAITRQQATAIGGTLAVRSAWLFGRRTGIEGDLRWRGATATMSVDGRRVEVPAGGLRAGIGLHLRF